jgi:hypothetical protein
MADDWKSALGLATAKDTERAGKGGPSLKELTERIIGCAIEVHRQLEKVTHKKVGLPMNFNSLLRDGIKRFVLD